MSAKCGLEYHKDTGDVLSARIQATKVGIADAPLTFVTPPYTTSQYNGQQTLLTATYSAFTRGGDAQKPAYDIQREAAIVIMDKTAEYVDGIAIGNVSIIEQAAFKAVNDGRVSATKPTQAQFVVALVGWPPEQSRGSPSPRSISQPGPD